MTYTYHCQYERANRVQHIVEEIGIGQVIKKSYTAGRYLCITDTGVTIIIKANIHIMEKLSGENQIVSNSNLDVKHLK